MDFLRAEHGYSALVDVYQGGRMHRVLYDAGVSPFGLVENLDRLGVSPDTFQRSCSAMGTSTTWPGCTG